MIPIGTVIANAGKLSHRRLEALERLGFLLADGRFVEINAYKPLWRRIGESFNDHPDGRPVPEGHFRLPDFRGRVVLGANPADPLTPAPPSLLTHRELGVYGGEESHILSVGEIPPHRHTYQIANKSGAIYDDFARGTSENARRTPTKTTEEGGGQAHNIMQPFLAVHYFIKWRHVRFDKLFELWEELDPNDPKD